MTTGKRKPFLGDENSMWVLNKLKASHSFTLDILSGARITILIPNTWIPIDVTQYATAEDITRSPNFRTMKAREQIEHISREEAVKILKRSGAADEQYRILGGVTGIEGPEEVEIIDQDGSEADDDELAVASLEGENETAAINKIMLAMNQGRLTEKFRDGAMEFAERMNYDRLQEVIKSAPSLKAADVSMA